ncbi:hypothetical protein Pyrfu_1398 [Pyrolobus fumarii 1A]|uniref:Uncharacterized protein n=1 Tax=Pyrolobus fumarii (strain DSM 11204 / 1A) TaxID=694429 RepID=G0EGV8_PYRF1|nr:hypothetical protein [Pyrolobus fumarii]AEM39256.1 hypothetical protein Pyrfu_1398 [Pyrolobus fumarii 1A]
MQRYSKSASSTVLAVLLLMLLASLAVTLLALRLYPQASKPASPPKLSEVKVEAVKAYAVEGFGTFIGIFERNIGDTSVPIAELEERGIAVYVYNWRGDLVAVNTSARVVREGVPDGVWEPGELIVVEAFVPVVLSGARLAVADNIPSGYIILERMRTGSGSITISAKLPFSNIRVVEGAATKTVLGCGLILRDARLSILPGSSFEGGVLKSDKKVRGIIGDDLVKIEAILQPVDATGSVTLETSHMYGIPNDIVYHYVQVDSYTSISVNDGTVASRLDSLLLLTPDSTSSNSNSKTTTIAPSKTYDVVYSVKLLKAYKCSFETIQNGQKVKTKGVCADLAIDIMVNGEVVNSITVDNVLLSGEAKSKGKSGKKVELPYTLVLDRSELSFTGTTFILKSLKVELTMIDDRGDVSKLSYAYTGGDTLPSWLSIVGYYKLGCIEVTGTTFTPPWRG